MNRITALILAVLTAGALAACDIQTPGGGPASPSSSPPSGSNGTLVPSEFNDTDFDTSGDIVMTTEHAVYGVDAPEIFYIITNNTDEEILYGPDYTVEIRLDGKWYRIEFPENTLWHDIGFILKPNGTNSGSFSFSQLDFTVTEGQYRLVKELGGRHYAAQFRIGDSPITAQTPFGYAAQESLPADYTAEAAAKNGDIVLLHNEAKNTNKLTEFLGKVQLGIPAMVRITEFTIEGDAIITDCLYNRKYFIFRHDNTRDKFGSGTGMTETIYSFVVTDGSDIYLSNCADRNMTSFQSADTVLLAWSSGFGDLTEAVTVAGELTQRRLEESTVRCKVFSPDGKRSAAITSEPLSYIYEGPEMSQTREVADPDGLVVGIADVFWLTEDAFVLVCKTSGDLKYYEVMSGSDVIKSGYGTDYAIADGQLEIVP